MNALKAKKHKTKDKKANTISILPCISESSHPVHPVIKAPGSNIIIITIREKLSCLLMKGPKAMGNLLVWLCKLHRMLQSF